MSRRLFLVMSFIGVFVLYLVVFLLALTLLASGFTGEFTPYHVWPEAGKVFITGFSMLGSFGLTLYTICD